MPRSEAAYQRKLIEKIQIMFPHCVVIKNDPAQNQGTPDLLILFGITWAMLEVKLSATSPVRPNQAYYVDLFDEMSFAAFIFPENEDEVLNALQSTFGALR